jgi:BirA family biotin operon repressor/biotin-[acetyl-CoA-carboxylase] ligase
VTWDGLLAEDLRDLCGVPRLELFDVTDSTLDVAHQLAQDGAPAGTVVLADAQRAGRGQFGRAWSSEPGRGVWVAIVERKVDLQALDVLSVRIGLEIAERLDKLSGAAIAVKWPNDLIRENKKVGGILVETRWSGSSLGWVAIGVGVNTVAPVDIPRATGLFGFTKQPSNQATKHRRLVLAAIVAGARAAASKSGHLSRTELERFNRRDCLSGKRIVEPKAGIVDGLESNGTLRITTRQGSERIRTGTIRMAEGT